MFLIGLLFSCIAHAHPVKHPPAPYAQVVVYTAPASRWVPGHYDRWGYWVPGRWIAMQVRHVSPPAPARDCHRHRDSRVHCGVHR